MAFETDEKGNRLHSYRELCSLLKAKGYYQRNGKDGKLGTEISEAMLKADKENAGLMKSLTWLPDLAFRIPIAMATISLIPWLLKNLFHIEKKKPAQPQPIENKQPVIENNKAEKLQPAFKGNTPSQVPSSSSVPKASPASVLLTPSTASASSRPRP